MIIYSTYYLVNFHLHTQCIFMSYFLTCTRLCVYVYMNLHSWVSTYVNLLINIANRKKYIVKFWPDGTHVVINKVKSIK